MSELAQRAAYLLVTLLLLIAGIHAYWALGGRWGLQIAIGEGNPLPSPPLIWLATAAFFAAGLTVLGRIDAWGTSLPSWIFSLGPWVLAVVFLGGAGVNLGGTRPWAPFVFAPAFLLLSLLAGVVGWWAPR